MNLETEFRIRLQLLRLSQSLYGCAYSVATEACIELFQPQLELQPEYQSSDWVKLKYPPSELSHDEALLLCQCSANHWLAWIPDHGEILLATDEFMSL